MDYFRDRRHAGELLAEKLLRFRDRHPIVLALPRGGVPVADEIAKRLACPLDLLMVKKIGAPGFPEVAVGAISEDSQPRLNRSFIDARDMDTEAIKSIVKGKTQEVQAQILRLRGNKAPLPIEGKSVIVVDDGIATGATLLAALQFLRTKNPKEIIVAAPVGAPDSILKLQAIADEVICLLAPKYLSSVGQWYEDFEQVSDDEVLKIMKSHRLPKNQDPHL